MVSKEAVTSEPMPSSASTGSSIATMSSLAAPVKFSRDIERLQKMQRVRKSPVGAQIKRVLDLLFQERKALTPEKINELCYVDMNRNKAVFESLKNNPKVRYDGSCFSYKPKHGVKDINELRTLIRIFLDGISVGDLKDAYPTVMEDLQSLKASGDIFLFKYCISREEIAYPNDLPPETINVDDDVKSLFFEEKLPGDMLDVEKYLKKNGIKPKTDNATRRAMAQMVYDTAPKPKTKKQRKLDPSKVTNIHMPELFK